MADAIFVALAVTAPDFEPADGRYPSNVVERFATVRAGVAERPTGNVTIETVPSGAAVFVDGTFRGYAPVDVGGLADGWHLVTVERLGYRPFGTLAPVPADQRSSVTLELEPSDAYERVQALGPALTDDEPGARALGEALGASAIAVLRYMTPLSGDRVEGILIPAEGAPVRIGPTPISGDPELAARTIADAFEARRVLAVDAKAPQVTPVTGEWWFWAAVGGAVLVAAAGTAAVVSATGRDGPPSNSGVVLGF